ncbi:hypothetical protein D3C72_1802510 [compost metagenome]
MTHRGDGFACGVKSLHQLDHLRVQAQILGRSAAGDQQRVVIFFFCRGKVGIQGETVARFFTVGLRAFEIMDCRHDVITLGLVRADGIHLMTNHLQCLKGHHGFIIFSVITNQHQDLFLAHTGISGRNNP